MTMCSVLAWNLSRPFRMKYSFFYSTPKQFQVWHLIVQYSLVCGSIDTFLLLHLTSPFVFANSIGLLDSITTGCIPKCTATVICEAGAPLEACVSMRNVRCSNMAKQIKCTPALCCPNCTNQTHQWSTQCTVLL